MHPTRHHASTNSTGVDNVASLAIIWQFLTSLLAAGAFTICPIWTADCSGCSADPPRLMTATVSLLLLSMGCNFLGDLEPEAALDFAGASILPALGREPEPDP